MGGRGWKGLEKERGGCKRMQSRRVKVFSWAITKDT